MTCGTGAAGRRVAAVVAAAAVLLALTGCSSGQGRAAAFSFVSPGGLTELSYPVDQRGFVDDLSGPDVTSDATLALSDWAGQVVVINVWGSWCGPCRAEADDLNQASAALAGRGVQFLGINVRDTRSAAADFMASKQVNYPSIYDPSLRTLLAVRGYPTSAIPSTLVLDRQRRVAHIFLRVVTADELIDVVGRIAAEPATNNTTSVSPAASLDGSSGAPSSGGP